MAQAIYSIAVVLIFIICILLILIVLVQNSKGGGLASDFTSSNQIMGVRRTTDFLEKATWTFATALVVLSIIASQAAISLNRGVSENEGSKLTPDQVDNLEETSTLPSFPTTVPQDEGSNETNE